MVIISGLGDRLARELQRTRDLYGQQSPDHTTSVIYEGRAISVKINVGVTYQVLTRSAPLTFKVGDDNMSKLDTTKVGKGEWTEVANG